MHIAEKLSSHTIFSINAFGFEIPITDTIIVMWIVMAMVILFGVILTRRMELVPKGKQNLAEMIVEFINNFAKTNIGHHGKAFAPYLGTVLLFLVFSNTISIFNMIPGEGFKLTPPTRNINVTACMAIMSILIVLFAGIRYKGFFGWLKSLAEPLPLIFPFKVLDYFIRPLSLCLRLFGNILGAFIIMELIYLVFPPIIPAFLSVYFDLFDGILQAYIFVFLTSLYIAEAIE